MTSGIDKVAVPVAGFTSTFSPTPPIAPPPFEGEDHQTHSGITDFMGRINKLNEERTKQIEAAK